MSVFIIRKQLIIKKLTECKAFSEQSAVTFRDAGVFNPNAFPLVTKKLVKDKVLGTANNNKYYLNRPLCNTK